MKIWTGKVHPRGRSQTEIFLCRSSLHAMASCGNHRGIRELVGPTVGVNDLDQYVSLAERPMTIRQHKQYAGLHRSACCG